MQTRTDFIPAKQHHPEESGFKEESGQHLIGKQRPGNTACEFRKTAPVGAELIGHHQTGNHAHAEIYGEYF